MLKAFAEIARNNSRAIDIPARLGGEEFAILLAGAEREDALSMAECLRQQDAALYKAKDRGRNQTYWFCS